MKHLVLFLIPFFCCYASAGFLNDIKNAFVSFGNSVKNVFVPIGKKIEKVVVAAGKDIKDFGKKVETSFVAMGKDIKDTVEPVGEDIKNFGKQVETSFVAMGKDIKDTFDPIGEDIKNTFEAIGEDLKNIFEPIIDEIKNTFDPPSDLPEMNMNVCQVIKYRGYPCENHEVVTADGYILSLQRIPHGRKNKNIGKQRPAAFLQHGLLDSAHTWVNNLPKQSLGFILADEGFDVWLGNSRGNTYSKRHVKMKPKTWKFWSFTWDEMAEYDLPACVDKILKITGMKTVSYVGHSQGTMISFAKLNHDKVYASKINSFIALAPVTTVGYIKSPIRFMAKFTKTLSTIMRVFGNGEFLPSSWFTKVLARIACKGIPSKIICDNMIFMLAGYSRKNTNYTRLPVYVSHNPAGTSVRNMVHYSQSFMSKRFEKFDFGEKENKRKYGQKTPPLYRLGKSNVPTAIFWGHRDWLADPKDVKLLYPQIKNLVWNQPISHYNHMDFVWGMDAHTVIYPRVIKIMKQYSGMN